MRMSAHPTARPSAPLHVRGFVLAATALLLAACATDAAEPEREALSGGAGSGPTEVAPDVASILELIHPSRGEPSSDLLVTDLLVGDGAVATDGDRVTVHYVGVRWSDGGRFDASWDRGQPFTFTLGAGQVIPGWELGVRGMQVGGRRVLTIPPGLAYGDRGAGSAIGPGETLVFVVDLLETGPS